MVLLGGLEVLAAGYLVHQHQKNKEERRRIEEEEEEAERRRRDRRHERRRERREKRSESVPPNEYRPSKDTKYTYCCSLPPSKAQQAPRPSQPAQYWAPPGPPPPPIQYAPQPAASLSQPQSLEPPRTAHSVSPLPQKAHPYFPPPPKAPIPSPPHQAAPPAGPSASYSSYDLPAGAYEMNGGEVSQHYLYANTHTPELRASSPPLGEQLPGQEHQRRARSTSRVRFEVPWGEDGQMVQVPTADMPNSPPPPYRP